MSINQQKEKIRKGMEAIIQKILKKEEISTKIQQKIIQSNDFKEAKIIGIYCAISEREVETKIIIESAWKEGKRVYIPKVVGESLQFFEIKNWTETEKGKYGIIEPKEIFPLKEKLNVIYVPGVAFTKTGKRIGKGKGYYDKFLNTNASLLGKKIGIAFSEQIVEDFETDIWDISMNEVIF